jgi:hypothetical protein
MDLNSAASAMAASLIARASRILELYTALDFTLQFLEIFILRAGKPFHLSNGSGAIHAQLPF